MKYCKPSSWLVTIAVLWAFALSLPLTAEDAGTFADRFAAATAERQEARITAVLADWKSAEPENAEPFIAAANYYGRRAQSQVEITSAPPKEGGIALEREGKIAGSIRASDVDLELAAKAAAELEAALKKFPARLDIWIGLAYHHQIFGNFEAQFSTLEKAVGYAVKHPAGLLWDEEKISDPAEAIASAAQGHMAYYLERNEPGGSERGLRLARLVNAAYPRHPFPINVIGFYYADRQEWSQAATYFEKALALAPDDPLVLMNVGIIDAKLGNKDKARSSFEKVLTLDADQEILDDAKRRLADLR